MPLAAYLGVPPFFIGDSMAASPRYKVHCPEGDYVASCKQIDAAQLLALYYGPGSKVRDGGGGKVIFEPSPSSKQRLEIRGLLSNVILEN